MKKLPAVKGCKTGLFQCSADVAKGLEDSGHL